MPYRTWLLIVALGLICSTSLLKAQEQAQGSEDRAAEQQQPAQILPIPLPVQII
jgi:hypothetical protein